MRFVAPPHWPPTPPGWQPPAGWQPPPEWGPAPEGWSSGRTTPRPGRRCGARSGSPSRPPLVVGSALGGLLSGGDDVARSMGYGFGRLLIPALVIGGAMAVGRAARQPVVDPGAGGGPRDAPVRGRRGLGCRLGP